MLNFNRYGYEYQKKFYSEFVNELRRFVDKNKQKSKEILEPRPVVSNDPIRERQLDQRYQSDYLISRGELINFLIHFMKKNSILGGEQDDYTYVGVIRKLDFHFRIYALLLNGYNEIFKTKVWYLGPIREPLRLGQMDMDQYFAQRANIEDHID